MSDHAHADVYGDALAPYETARGGDALPYDHRGALQLDPYLLADAEWCADALDKLEHCACVECQEVSTDLIGSCACPACLGPDWAREIGAEAAARAAVRAAEWRASQRDPHGLGRLYGTGLRDESEESAARAGLAGGTAVGMLAKLKPHYRVEHPPENFGQRIIVWTRSMELLRLLAHPTLRFTADERKSDKDYVRFEVRRLLEHLKFTGQEHADRAALRAGIEGNAA